MRTEETALETKTKLEVMQSRLEVLRAEEIQELEKLIKITTNEYYKAEYGINYNDCFNGDRAMEELRKGNCIQRYNETLNFIIPLNFFGFHGWIKVFLDKDTKELWDVRVIYPDFFKNTEELGPVWRLRLEGET